MALTPRSFQELYDIYKNRVQALDPELTDFSDGSVNDILAGSTATLVQELTRLLLDRFRLTYLASSTGQDLEFLATDHFGDKFARPGATRSVGIVTFSRPNTDAGNITIPTGTIVKTGADANGESQRFETIAPVTITTLEINASIRAIEGGPRGNVQAGSITEIETALTDPSIVVTNDDETTGGAAELSDADYRVFVENLIEQLKGATKAAVLAAAQNVAGVENVAAIEFAQTVIEYDESVPETVGEPFKISRVRVYIADANGNANAALIANVEAAILETRACGVFVSVLGASPFSLDWDASITLDPGGPNFASLQSDPQPILDDMTEYLQDLSIGSNFNRALARQAILNIWGPAGSGDLTNFEINDPSGDVSLNENQKIIPGTVSIT
jgi:hypothetical protein